MFKTYNSHEPEKKDLLAELTELGKLSSKSPEYKRRHSELQFRSKALQELEMLSLTVDDLVEQRAAGSAWKGGFPEFLSAVRKHAMGTPPGGYGYIEPDPRLLQFRGVAAGSNEAVPSDGGFAVPTEFIPRLLGRLYQTGEILSRCFDVPISDPRANGVSYPVFDESSRANGSRMGGVSAHWLNEADAITPSKPKFGRGELELKKLAALLYLTNELASDSLSNETFAVEAFSQEMAFSLENAIISGDGSGKPKGVLNSAALIKVAPDALQPAATISTTNVVTMWSHLWAPSRKNSVWLVNPEAERQLLTLYTPVGTAGVAVPLYVPTEDPDKQPYNLMLGRPVIPVEHCPVAGTVGDLMFCDFSRYLLAMKENLLTRSIHVRFLTDEQAWKFVMRVDGQTLDQRPITPLNGTATVSPFVAIDTRT